MAGRSVWKLLGLLLLWRFKPTFFSLGNGPRPTTKSSDTYLTKVAHAVDVLKADVPDMFSTFNGLAGRVPDWSVYSERIQFSDERAPSLGMHGLSTYKRFVQTIRWTLRSMFEESKLEVTSVSKTLVNGELSIRWRLHLWPKGLLTMALQFFSAPLAHWGWHQNFHQSEAPFIVEGYSIYEFDPWTAEVTQHKVDIKNPPMFLADLFKQYSTAEMHAVPAGMPYATQGIRLRGSRNKFDFAGATVGSIAASKPRMAATATRAAADKSSWPIPDSCEDDFDCNDGRANFPLQCCELPLLGKFCCKPPDGDPSPDKKDPAWLPLPVPSNDP